MFFPHPSVNWRFSEVYVPELEDRLDLKRVVDGYIAGVSLETDNLAFTAVDLYLWARGLAGESLSDGAGQRPRYSLRYIIPTSIVFFLQLVFLIVLEYNAASKVYLKRWLFEVTAHVLIEVTAQVFVPR